MSDDKSKKKPYAQKGKKKVCSGCGKAGHNIRTCTGK